MRSLSLFVGSVALLASFAAAQVPQFVQPGQIVVAGGPWLGEMAVSGATNAVHTAATSIITSLWDPARPDSFVVGSGSNSSTGGQLARMTFTAPGQVTTTPIAAPGSFARPETLAWDPSGQTVVALTYFSQLHRIDVVSGNSVAITSGTQSWGSTATCCAVSPTTADIFVGTSSGQIYRLGSGGGSPQLLRSGLDSLVELLIDGTDNRLFAVGRLSLCRIDLNTLAAPEYFFGSLGTPTYPDYIVGASFDQNGDVVLAESHEVLRLPNLPVIPAGGVLPTRIGVFTFPTSAGYVRDVTVVGSTWRPFRLIAEAVVPLGARLEVQNVPVGATHGFTLISTSTLLPADTGPMFGLLPDALTFAILGFPTLPGNIFAYAGTAPLPFVVPPLGMAAFAGQTFDLVGVAFGAGGRLIGRTNLRRVTWN
jgi:hypothetical protein